MNYKFPWNITIKEVRDTIKDREEFFEAERDDYIVFNYKVCFPNTFPPVIDRETAILRELRGLIFDHNGNVISRRFHKFFNVGEKEETRPENFPIYGTQSYLKVDGSMVTPVLINGGIRWFSKMGETQITDQVEQYLAKDPNIQEFMNSIFSCLNSNLTPIFEWTAPYNRIVVGCEEKLTLLAVRGNYSGEYLNIDSNEFSMFNRPKKYPFFGMNTIDARKDLEGEEGVVVVFNDGHRVKMKTNWYVQLHRVKSHFTVERHMVRIILDNQLDDLLATLSDEDKEWVTDYSNEVKRFIAVHAAKVEALNTKIHQEEYDRKRYALEEKPNVPAFYSQIIFNLWNHDFVSVDLSGIIHEYVSDILKDNIHSGSKFEKYKSNTGWSDNIKWKFGEHTL